MALLNFFATGQGVLTLGILAALIVLLWDWRVALLSLVLIQIGVATLLTEIEGVSGQVMLVQTLIMALSAMMVAIAALQVHLRRSGRQSGGWLFRLLVLSLLGIALYSLDLSVVLPDVAPAIARIFGWIALIALIMLSLGDNPVFTTTALLIWCVLGQAMAALYAPAPEVMITIGLLELVLGLTASYLLLAEELPRRRMAEVNASMAAARAMPGAPPPRAGDGSAPPLFRRAAGTQTNLPAVPPNLPSQRAARSGTDYDLVSVAPPRGDKNAPNNAQAGGAPSGAGNSAGKVEKGGA